MAPERIVERTDPHDPTEPAAVAAERARLVRLCAHLAGDPAAAEDLAQETLLLAWRLRDRLTTPGDPQARARWLAAIARNICLRWRRAHSRDRVRLAHLAAGPLLTAGAPAWSAEGATQVAAGLRPSPVSPSLADTLPDDSADLELELERDELADLLDRALALLPSVTRDVLIARFIHDKPQAEVAARLGVSEDVVAQRLHRGKLTLRRLLTTDLRHEAAPYLAISPDAPASAEPAWQETRVWCPFCGRHRLLSYVNRDTGDFAMHCAGNCHAGLNVVGMASDPTLVVGLTSPKSLLARHCLALSDSYRRRLAARTDVCPGCGGTATVHLGIAAPAVTDPLLAHGIAVECPRCGMLDDATAYHLTIDTPQAVAFWRRHPRMRPLPVREIEYAGRPALLTGFESVGDSARLEIVSARDTWQTLHADEGAAR